MEATPLETNRSLPDSFATRIKILLNNLPFSHVWDNQSTFSKKNRLLHAIYEKFTKNFKMCWKTRIFYDSMNGNKLRRYRKLKEKYETDTYLFFRH